MSGVSRRGFLAGLGVGAAALAAGWMGRGQEMVTVYTFGDSILDCGHYNEHGVHPGQLLVRNDDRLFPEFRGRDLSSRGEAQLDHRAVDGARVPGLPSQVRGLNVPAGTRSVALITIGGNDLLGGLIADSGPGIEEFARRLEDFVRQLPMALILLGNVYDPTLGDDRRNFLYVDPALGRMNHGRINAAIADVAGRYGRLVDLHSHFLSGDETWFVSTIEPSLRGASEVRRCFLEALE